MSGVCEGNSFTPVHEFTFHQDGDSDGVIHVDAIVVCQHKGTQTFGDVMRVRLPHRSNPLIEIRRGLGIIAVEEILRILKKRIKANEFRVEGDQNVFTTKGQAQCHS